MITREFGEEIAKDVGFIHEANNKSLDSQVDILNNEIGRKIGSVNKKSSNKSMAIIAIKEFYKNGFWTYNMDNEIERTKLSEAQYKKALEEIQKKGNNGLNQK